MKWGSKSRNIEHHLYLNFSPPWFKFLRSVEAFKLFIKICIDRRCECAISLFLIWAIRKVFRLGVDSQDLIIILIIIQDLFAKCSSVLPLSYMHYSMSARTHDVFLTRVLFSHSNICNWITNVLYVYAHTINKSFRCSFAIHWTRQ